MTFNTSVTSTTTLIFSVFILSACGSGSDSSSNNNSASSKPKPPAISSPTIDTKPNLTNVKTENHRQAALVVANKLSLERQSCGLKGLATDNELDKVAIGHANYIKYVFANSTPQTFSPHFENKISDIEGVTERNNPFFGGIRLEDRLKRVNDSNLAYSTTENIARTTYYSSLGKAVAPEYAALSMVKSLLAAPYHLRTLMLPNLSKTGTSVVSYTPYEKNAAQNQGYVLVNNAAATKKSVKNTVQGVFTYPCNGVTDTNTALYNESPNPLAGSDRNLSDNPIGQPIYISMPSAKNIEVSNVKFRDVQRQVDINVQMLDYRQDPHKGTENELPANEAFILPLTDMLKSCKTGRKKGGNCGLYGNSEYRVSFDILVDKSDLISQSFTFKTGAVNY